MIANIIKEISTLNDKKKQYEIIVTFLKDILDSDVAECMLFDEAKNILYSEAKNSINFSTLHLEGILGKIFSITKPAFFNYIRSEKLYQAEIDNPYSIKLKAQLIYPVLKEERLIGIFRFSRIIGQAENYTQQDIKLLESIENYLINIIVLMKNQGNLIEVDQGAIAETIKKLEEQNKKAQQEMNDTVLFLSNTVHDIRTPANSLFGFLELMEEQIEDKKLLNFVKNAKESAMFINALTDSILEKVKYDNEVRTSSLEIVNSIAFFADTANIFCANMTSKGVHFLVKIDPMMPKKIKTEKIKLKRILINLIGNAYKFTPTQKTIEFNVSYKEGRIFISIKDTGLGIEESSQKAIFKAFEQAKEDTSIHYGGTGLGLAICSKYVNDLGGDLKLTSKVDEGSDFYFDIPAQIVDVTPSYAPYLIREKIITIFTDNVACIDANLMKWHFEQLGISPKRVFITEEINKNTTHLICFEHMLSDAVIKTASEHHMKLVLFENKLFSLSKQERYKAYPIMSKNNYYTDVLYGAVATRFKPKVLIVDDNKINVSLLVSILEGEYCEVMSKYNAEDALKILTEALESGNPFDILFSDKNMEEMSGTEMLKHYRDIELKYPNQKTIYAVSITGNGDLSELERNMYNCLVCKPFKKVEIIDALTQI